MLCSATRRLSVWKALEALPSRTPSVLWSPKNCWTAWTIASIPAFWPAQRLTTPVAWSKSARKTCKTAFVMMRRGISPMPIGRMPDPLGLLRPTDLFTSRASTSSSTDGSIKEVHIFLAKSARAVQSLFEFLPKEQSKRFQCVESPLETPPEPFRVAAARLMASALIGSKMTALGRTGLSGSRAVSSIGAGAG